MAEPPIACTLPLEELGQRYALIRELSRGALLRSHRTALTLHLTYDHSVAARVRQLVRQEQSCCAFLVFELAEDAEGVQLVITVPEQARDAADLIYAQFLAEAEPCSTDAASIEKEAK